MIFTRLIPSAIHKCSQIRKFHVCIVGSGPSAFYVAQSLLKVSFVDEGLFEHFFPKIEFVTFLWCIIGEREHACWHDWKAPCSLWFSSVWGCSWSSGSKGIIENIIIICSQNVIHTFTHVAKNPRFNYYGNITVGRDVRLNQLRRFYDAIVMSYGASADRRMNIDGEVNFDRWFPKFLIFA